MTIRTVAEQTLIWYEAYLGCGKDKDEAERMAVEQVEERYGNDFEIVKRPTPLFQEPSGLLPGE